MSTGPAGVAAGEGRAVGTTDGAAVGAVAAGVGASGTTTGAVVEGATVAGSASVVAGGVRVPSGRGPRPATIQMPLAATSSAATIASASPSPGPRVSGVGPRCGDGSSHS